MKYNDPKRIEEYLQGIMDNESQKDFESAMAEDVDLQQEVELMKDLLGGIQSAGDEQLSQSIELAEITLEEKGYFKDYEETLDQDVLGGIQQFGAATDKKRSEDNKNVKSTENEEKSKQSKSKEAKTKKLPLRRILAIAASFLVFITLSIYFLNNGNNNYEEAFANNFEQPQKLLDEQIIAFSELGIATPDKEKKTKLKELLEALKTCADPTCKTIQITTFETAYPNDPTAIFFLATAQMEQKKYELATQYLKPLTSNANFDLQEDAEWYQALCYLKMETKQSEARALFQEIAKKEDAKYTSKAKAILMRMK